MDILTFLVCETMVVAVPPIVWLLDRRHKRQYDLSLRELPVKLEKVKTEMVAAIIEQFKYYGSSREGERDAAITCALKYLSGRSEEASK